jgi:hypothetical protein
MLLLTVFANAQSVLLAIYTNCSDAVYQAATDPAQQFGYNGICSTPPSTNQ